MLTLKAEKRDTKQNTAKLRETGMIPAVFYGKKEASTPISLNKADFLKTWKEAGESTIVIIETPEGELESLIHSVDVDPVSGDPRHADFYVFEKGHKVEVDLPIEFEGTSPAVKDLGGVLVKVLHEIKVEAQPRDLPHHIIIDIGVLKNLDDQVVAGDLRMPEGVELKENPEEVIVLVSEPKEEEEEEEAPMDLSEIEVEKKGKEASEESEAESSDEGESKEE